MARFFARILLAFYQAVVTYRVHTEQQARLLRLLLRGSATLLLVGLSLIAVCLGLSDTGQSWVFHVFAGWIGLAALGASGLLYALREQRIDRMMRAEKTQREIFVLDWFLFLVWLVITVVAVVGLFRGLTALPYIMRGSSDNAKSTELKPAWTQRLDGDARGVAFGPAGDVLAGGVSGVVALDPDTHQPKPGKFRLPLSMSTGQLSAANTTMYLRGESTELRVLKDAKIVEFRSRPEGAADFAGDWKVLAGHETPVASIALAADGTTALSGGKDGSVRVWDLPTGQQRWVLRGHTKDVQYLAISEDGKVAISGSYDQSARAWDLASGQPRKVWQNPQKYIGNVGLSMDGRIGVVLIRATTEVIVWDTTTGAELRNARLQGSFLSLVTVNQDGKRVAATGLAGVSLWDLP